MEKLLAQLPAEMESEEREAVKAAAVAALLHFADAVQTDREREPSRESAKAPATAAPESQWEDPVDGAALLAAIVGFIRQYLNAPDAIYRAMSLWAVHTYAVEAAWYTPYLWVTSPSGTCAKTLLLDLLEVLAARARKQDAISPASLARIAHAEHPTFLLDELDGVLKVGGEKAENLRTLLHAGFKRGARCTLCVGDDHEPRDFDVYGPKALAGIGRLWLTVQSRSIPLRMQRATKAELAKLKRVRGDRLSSEAAPLRSQALRWAADHLEGLRAADPVVPPALGAREADIWRPLLAIADAAGETWPDWARAAAVLLHKVNAADAEDGPVTELLLGDLRDHFGASLAAEDGYLRMAEILPVLHALEDRPWGLWRTGKGDEKPITSHAVGRLLRGYGLAPEQMKVSGIRSAATAARPFARRLSGTSPPHSQMKRYQAVPQ